ncbi:uncharacterized protein [Gossypium hirsutum]|uniref:Uncharacterized protein isoform X6 n=1 Tax=Gossypium hirsutum TaxID=3635 RepID=A0ABM3BML2_GOSHI|nr:uncharacterized protein LOC107957360 isoform X6 [Gossypium hirsutum]
MLQVFSMYLKDPCWLIFLTNIHRCQIWVFKTDNLRKIKSWNSVGRMASWCRKCIYLKPKLEKLAADYYPRLRFYCVDVNTVPHNLVARAGVTKMPTIQVSINSLINQNFYLDFYVIEKPVSSTYMDTGHIYFPRDPPWHFSKLWRDSKKQAEVIGGHKAYLVVNEVRQMIENECTA